MPTPRRRAPTRFLLDPSYWKGRLAGMDAVNRGLLMFARPDLSSPMVDVIEWRLKAHDGKTLWGIKGHSAFHQEPKGVWIREFGTTEPPSVCLEAIYEGCIDFAMQLPAGRRLEDRVLDTLRVWQAAAAICHADPRTIRLVPLSESRESDEFLIAKELLHSGICSLP